MGRTGEEPGARQVDGSFIADVLGVYEVYRGNAALRQSAQMPVNDPLQVVPAMALVTEHLGFGLRASLSFEHPFTFASRLVPDALSL